MLSFGTSGASGDDGAEVRVVGNPVGSLETSLDDSLNDNNEKSLDDSLDLWEVKEGDSACKSDFFPGSPSDNKASSFLRKPLIVSLRWFLRPQGNVFPEWWFQGLSCCLRSVVGDGL